MNLCGLILLSATLVTSKRIQYITVLIPFILEDPWLGIIFLGYTKSSKSVSEFETKIKNFGNIDYGCVIYS